ncbi:YceD family protein [Mycolicibacterium sp. Dal123E01]|uniref:YceD family protein n=1 Tax=Mycolicibacterium sp. Dal123E01 TaxID=3457578 RepID=UPI00403EC952
MATQRSARPKHKPPSPLAFDVSRLGRRPGSMLELRETVPSPSRIGLDLVAIERGAYLNLDLRLESVSEGVLVTGTVQAPTRGECSRCLTPITGEVEIFLTELFAYPDSATESTTEEDEVGHVVDQTVDLEQAIVDAVGLALPFTPLCSDNCPGLCQQCGVALASAEPDHHHDQIDPRFAKLAKMFPAADEETTAERGPGAS